ncbi:MAG: hypothetical protein GEU82_09750 [Luteitalea sp.]|nr:hypothetical protein [Luteitalea sp.]
MSGPLTSCFRAFVAAVGMLCAGGVSAAERYALIVTGASGGPEYAEKYDAWRAQFVNILLESFDYPADHIRVLAEDDSGGGGKATRENVRQALADLRRVVAKDDVVLLLLIGHGSGGEVDEAKFNLVGPDIGADEWETLVRPLAGRVVFVNTASGSFPFLKAIALRGRVVLTANDSAAQQFETVFPEFFVKAFTDHAADLDKNGRVSIWEAFTFTSDGVRGWYESRGQLSTERPLLDDTGSGVGREAGTTEGLDGPVAQVTYLQPDAPIADTGDSELTGLLRRRAELQSQLEELKARKPNMLPDDYDAALEELLVELARVDRRIRSRS